MQRKNTNRRFNISPRFQAIVLTLTILLTVAVGTLAWLKYVRSQQTVTLVHVSDRYLLGPDGSNSTAINLGSIDVSQPGSQFYAFGVKSGKQSYRLQLAYTTNIPFMYTIHRAIRGDNEDGVYNILHQEGGYNFYYDQTPLEGGYLNIVKNGSIANSDKHDVSFGSNNNNSVLAQKNAEPLYWQTKDVDKVLDIDYFVLEVEWNDSLPNDKETDMIYLTVGAPQGGS